MKRALAAMAVVFGSIGFMMIGINAMKPDDHVMVYDAKTGTKYRVSMENYSRNAKEE
jgi:hypothetical protein